MSQVRIFTVKDRHLIGNVLVDAQPHTTDTVRLIFPPNDRSSSPTNEVITRSIFELGIVDRLDGSCDIISRNRPKK